MRFDYNFGTEATFKDWEEEGCDKAKAILEGPENDEETAEEKNTSENDK